MSKDTIIINYHTTGTTAPAAADLELGEIAVQANATAPKLYIKDTSNNLVEFTPGGSSGGEVPVIQKGTSDTTFTIEPNKVYVWDTVTSLDISLATPSSDSVVNHYFFQFISGPTATTLSLPDNLIYIGDSTIVANRKYQCSIFLDVAKLGGAAYYTLEPIVDFNVTTDIGATASTATGTKTYDVTDDQGNTVTFSVIGGGSNWSVTTSTTYTYTINGTSYSGSYNLYLQTTGSTSKECVSVALDGPCTIYVAARRTGNNTTTMYAYVGSSSIGSFTVSSSTSITVGTINYTGTGGTLYIYPSRAAYLYHVEIDYNV